ncbi:MAG: hypothetical protein ACF8OB_16280 [Phycisphaeraceae bacterium JB051]
MSDSDTPCIYCPSCGQEHPWLGYLKGQEFQCACGHVMTMPDEPPQADDQPPSKANVETGTTYSLDALVDSGAGAAVPANSAADDSDELEVIEDDELEVIEEDGQDQTVSDENLYELSTNEKQTAGSGLQVPPRSAPPTSPQPVSPRDDLASVKPLTSEQVDTRQTPKRGITTSAYCKTQYPFRDPFCPQCGRDDLGHVHDTGKGKDNEDSARLRIMGIPCTPVTIGVVATVMLLFGYLGFWFITGPAAKFRYYDMQVVDANILMTTDVTRTKGIAAMTGIGALGGGGGFAGGGDGTQAGSSTLEDDPGFLTAGSRDSLYAFKPNTAGQHVVLDVAIRQSMLDNNNARSGYDMVLVSSSFTLRQGDKVIPTMILMESMPNRVEVDLSTGSSDIKTAYPPGIVPEEIDWDDFNKLPIEGKATFKGAKGLTGDMSFYIYALHPDAINAKGMVINGQLSYVSPDGIQANYTYNGGGMKIDVDPVCEVWRAVPDEKFKADWSPYHQFRFRLIFDRPDSGKYGLYFQDIHVKNIKIP